MDKHRKDMVRNVCPWQNSSILSRSNLANMTFRRRPKRREYGTVVTAISTFIGWSVFVTTVKIAEIVAAKIAYLTTLRILPTIESPYQRGALRHSHCLFAPDGCGGDTYSSFHWAVPLTAILEEFESWPALLLLNFPLIMCSVRKILLGILCL